MIEPSAPPSILMIGLGVDLALDYGHQSRKPIIEPMSQVISIKLHTHMIVCVQHYCHTELKGYVTFLVL
jgi:hypothetical protein